MLATNVICRKLCAGWFCPYATVLTAVHPSQAEKGCKGRILPCDTVLWFFVYANRKNLYSVVSSENPNWAYDTANTLHA